MESTLSNNLTTGILKINQNRKAQNYFKAIPTEAYNKGMEIRLCIGIASIGLKGIDNKDLYRNTLSAIEPL